MTTTLLSTTDKIGYCTNVHAGPTLATMQQQLSQHACSVKAQASPTKTMGIGLWFAAEAAKELSESAEKLNEVAKWLANEGLLPFTLNGFPYGNFHQEVVKHQVYLPVWGDARRTEYTCRLADILHKLLPAGETGSISTLPIAWGTPELSEGEWQAAAREFAVVAKHLHKLEQETGRLIHVCIEPEPGCALDTAEDLVGFFQKYLFQAAPEAVVRRHLRICHDVCHSMVMFEEQAHALKAYHSAGIDVGKVQVSSAVLLKLDELAVSERKLALEQLSKFVEPRYLHQTVVRQDGKTHFFEDLPLALEALGSTERGEWRVHFHVPIYLEKFGYVQTSRPQILECLEWAKRLTTCTHFEAETYAWGVLPPSLRQPTLAHGIAEEMKWLTALQS